MIYKSTKTYGHDIGLSCAFRQWASTTSHCRFIHGYAIKVHLEFSAHELDGRNWVLDFGALKPIKQMLEKTFDHKLLVAEDDPMRYALTDLQDAGLAQVVILPAVGCEKFAEHIARLTQTWLTDTFYGSRVWLSKVEVAEHGANSAIIEFEEGEIL